MEKLVTETRPVIEPKVKVLEQSIAKRLGITEPAASAGTPPTAVNPAGPFKTTKPAPTK